MRIHAFLSILGLASWGLAGCGRRDQPQTFAPAPSTAASSATTHPTEIHSPAKLWSVETGKVDALGRPIRVACVTCHSLRTPEKLPECPEDLKQFHVGLKFAHGGNVCASCHVIGDQSSLKLADGTLIPNVEAMRLCGQCHGPQLRDYQKGAHGGMSGHWDLASGARLRNHCVDCHDPHVPEFQPSIPVLPPRDRLLGPPTPHGGGPAIPTLAQGPSGGHP